MTKKIDLSFSQDFFIYQWSFNVDKFMQTFDSYLIKNPVKTFVFRCSILCSKFAKIVCRPGSAWTRWGSLQRSPDPVAGSWGKGGEWGDESERAGGKKEGKWEERAGKKEGRERKTEGREGEVGVSTTE